MKCPEETERDQRVKALEEAEGWVRVVVVVARDLGQALADTASALAAVKGPPINWGLHAIIKNVRNAALP